MGATTSPVPGPYLIQADLKLQTINSKPSTIIVQRSALRLEGRLSLSSPRGARGRGWGVGKEHARAVFYMGVPRAPWLPKQPHEAQGSGWEHGAWGQGTRRWAVQRRGVERACAWRGAASVTERDAGRCGGRRSCITAARGRRTRPGNPQALQGYLNYTKTHSRRTLP